MRPEPQFADHLNVAAALRYDRDRCRVSSTNMEVRLPERWMVQDIGRVRAEVEGHTLPDRERFFE